MKIPVRLERVVFAVEGIRLTICGDVDAQKIESLEWFIAYQKKKMAEVPPGHSPGLHNADAGAKAQVANLDDADASVDRSAARDAEAGR